MEVIGQAISAAAAAVGFTILVGVMLAEEAQALWLRLTTTWVVCRGCGRPVPLPTTHVVNAVPYCSGACAAAHPNRYPEET